MYGCVCVCAIYYIVLVQKGKTLGYITNTTT